MFYFCVTITDMSYDYDFDFISRWSSSGLRAKTHIRDDGSMDVHGWLAVGKKVRVSESFAMQCDNDGVQRTYKPLYHYTTTPLHTTHKQELNTLISTNRYVRI